MAVCLWSTILGQATLEGSLDCPAAGLLHHFGICHCRGRAVRFGLARLFIHAKTNAFRVYCRGRNSTGLRGISLA